jgi:hypothetical protein
MSKNIHTATLPNGKTVTRTSSSGRAYEFCVAVRESYATALAIASRRDDKTDRSNYEYHIEQAQRTPGEYPQFNQFNGKTYMVAVTEAQHAGHVAAIAGCSSAAEYGEARRAERIAKVEARKAAGAFEAWGVYGWQSRRDLADKAKASALAGGYNAEAVILPVTMVTK